MLSRLFISDDDDQFGDFPSIHPLFELGHNLFNVCLDLIIGIY